MVDVGGKSGDDLRLSSCVDRRGEDDLLEQIGVDVMRTAKNREKAAMPNAFHRQPEYVLVSAARAVDFPLAFRETRRIQNHRIEWADVRLAQIPEHIHIDVFGPRPAGRKVGLPIFLA